MSAAISGPKGYEPPASESLPPVQSRNLHQRTTALVYGWTDYTPATPDDDILRRLLALNRTRSRPET